LVLALPPERLRRSASNRADRRGHLDSSSFRIPIAPGSRTPSPSTPSGLRCKPLHVPHNFSPALADRFFALPCRRIYLLFTPLARGTCILPFFVRSCVYCRSPSERRSTSFLFCDTVATLSCGPSLRSFFLRSISPQPSGFESVAFAAKLTFLL